MKIIDNVLLQKDIFTLYKSLIDSGVWSLNRSSLPNPDVGTFPGFIVKHENQIFNNYWDGYFTSLYQNINNRYKELYGYTLPNTIRRIHLGAKNDSSVTEFHCDEDLPNAYTIVGFLTPVWAKEWGGDLLVEDKKINIQPGRFAAFKTNVRHNGEGPNQKIPYWRISINYVVEDK